MGDARVRVKERSVTVVANPGWKNSSPRLCFEDVHGRNRDKRFRRERHGSSESLVRRCLPASVAHDRWHRAWPRGPRSMARCVARDRWHRAWTRGPRSMAPCVARDRWHRAWPARDLNAKTISKRCAIDGTVRGPVARDRWHRAWPAIDGTVRGPRSMAQCVAPWPAIDGTVRGPRSMTTSIPYYYYYYY